MGSIVQALEMHHTVNARKGSASTLVAMRIQLLLGQNVSASLATRLASLDCSTCLLSTFRFRGLSLDGLLKTPWACQLTSHENDTILTRSTALERYPRSQYPLCCLFPSE